MRLNDAPSDDTVFPVKISIIVPAFNEERLLGESLAQISAAMVSFQKPGWTTELIVCDNNSTDATAQIARAAGAKVVFEPINQIARARNTGASSATGDWLIFVDADSHPSADLFADVAKEIQAGDCIAGGATIRMDEYHFAANWIVKLWNLTSRRLRLLAGSFIFCEAATFRKVGGFSNDLFAAEELELSVRLKKTAKESGKKLVVLHRHPLVTSARKMKLYTIREHLRFVFAAVFNRRTFASREAAHLWYDGRR
ncbi:MAG TPA: glycosyltransferase [Verrucomicrobiae bacterium]|jgi:glycosyltransferase involved in cell wall biosynthesis